MTASFDLEPGACVALVGFGVTNQAAARALVARGYAVAVLDDRPGDAALAAATELGIEVLAGPNDAEVERVVAAAACLLPTPGLPDHHRALTSALVLGVPVVSEFDLARMWDDRPILAITGTNGKTTVTTLVTAMLEASGRHAAAVGNTDVPLIAAIDDDTIEVFVVEASSFRLGHSTFFAPDVASWLNFAPDHLDVHASVGHYEAAKARIWRDQRADQHAVANLDDPTVMAHATGPAQVVTFGLHEGDSTVVDGKLVVFGEALLDVVDLTRRLPHDVANALAAATTAILGGATRSGAVEVLTSFGGIPHRMQLIGERDAIAWYDDSKATTPHAVIAAMGGFDSGVLIAGGRNKGVDLGGLAVLAPQLRAVVAIGEAAQEIAEVFGTAVPVRIADDMATAVATARSLARSGDAVVLSPACASFDWYLDYNARGDDFAAFVRTLVLEAD